MHNFGYKSALARRACRYSDARPPRKTDGIPPESESPPRMRGKGYVEVIDVHVARITPAYAGKRIMRLCWVIPDSGSPPHMRGKVRLAVAHFPLGGITPAYAGKRFVALAMPKKSQDYPRVCGEKRAVPLATPVRVGSPPRMRGKAGESLTAEYQIRITPAYAGKSTQGKKIAQII